MDEFLHGGEKLIDIFDPMAVSGFTTGQCCFSSWEFWLLFPYLAYAIFCSFLLYCLVDHDNSSSAWNNDIYLCVAPRFPRSMHTMRYSLYFGTLTYSHADLQLHSNELNHKDDWIYYVCREDYR